MDDDSQSDLLFSILQQIEDGSITADDIPAAACSAAETSSEQPTPSLVGTPTAELESIKELIKFDHIYYKPDTSVKSMDCDVNIIVEYQDIELDNGVSEEVVEQVPVATEYTAVASNENTNIEHNDSFELQTTDLSSKADVELDIDSLLDLESIDWNSIVLDVDSLVQENCDRSSTTTSCDNDTQKLPHSCSNKSTSISHVPSTSSRKRKHSVHSPVSHVQKLSPNLSDELLDLVSQNTSISESSSGYGSELSDAGSPYSDLSALDEDSDLWQESFTELFPSLV